MISNSSAKISARLGFRRAGAKTLWSQAVLWVVLCSLCSLSAQAQQPVSAGSATVVDVPSGSADVVRLELQKARFADQSADRLNLQADGIDFKQGRLKQLTADLQNALFDRLPVDGMHLTTGSFSFDPVELLNHRRFILAQPVNGVVQLKISEASLNHYFQDPQTVDRLQKALNRKLGNAGLIKISQPSLSLPGKNRLKAAMTMSFAGAVGTPVELQGQLGLQSGKLLLSDVNVTSNGVALPVDLAGTFTSKFNEAIDFDRLGKKTFVIRASKLANTARQLDIQGTVQLTRLEFGNQN